MAVIANDLRRGMAVTKDGDIYIVLNTTHRTPGNKRAFVQASFRSLRSGLSSDHRLASDERLSQSSTAALAIVLIGLLPVLLLTRATSSR